MRCARLRLHHVEHRPRPGLEAAAERADVGAGRCPWSMRVSGALRRDHVAGERRLAQEVAVDRFAVAGDRARAVRATAGEVDRVETAAVRRRSGQAQRARAARGEGHRDVVTGLDGCTAVPTRSTTPAPSWPEHDRSREEVGEFQVGAADPDARDADQHLVGAAGRRGRPRRARTGRPAVPAGPRRLAPALLGVTRSCHCARSHVDMCNKGSQGPTAATCLRPVE